MALHFPSPIPEIRRPLTFIHIPKTAGTSFTRWVVANNIDHGNEAKHGTRQKASEIWTDLGYVFTFVRNPYDRLVSYFHYVGQQAEAKLQAYASGAELKKRMDPEQELSILQIYRQGFYYWFCHEARGEPTAMTLSKTFMHWRSPQTTWSRDCDRVIRTEELTENFEWLQHYFRCYEPLPELNTSERGHYRDYYNPETRALATKMFENDLDELGYTF